MFMKLALLPSILAAFVFGFTSCQPNQGLTLTSKKSTEFVLPGSSVTGIYIKLDAEAVATDVAKLATDNRTTIELLDKATITNLVVTLTEPTSTTVNFIDEFELYLKKPNGDTLSIALKDTLDNSEKVLSTITLKPKSRTELIDWFKEENLYYVARMKINSFSPNDRVFSISSTYSIEGTRE